MGVTAKKFGNLTSGEEITLYHLENKSGAYAEVMDYGAILVKLCDCLMAVLQKSNSLRCILRFKWKLRVSDAETFGTPA